MVRGGNSGRHSEHLRLRAVSVVTNGGKLNAPESEDAYDDLRRRQYAC